VQLIADILEPSVRVLVREGAHCFTTARVTEMTGISVGSLYQYFPNKEAIVGCLRPVADGDERLLSARRAAYDGRLQPISRMPASSANRPGRAAAGRRYTRRGWGPGAMRWKNSSHD
jgi:AcrR family transcriptional regulator